MIMRIKGRTVLHTMADSGDVALFEFIFEDLIRNTDSKELPNLMNLFSSSLFTADFTGETPSTNNNYLSILNS
jgi:hypothetical protein